MENGTSGRRKWAFAIRWTARAWSVASIALVLAFVIGEGIHPSAPNEVLGLMFFPFGICLGMILAWRSESLGGGITVGSLVVFYVIHAVTAGSLPKGWAWIAFAAPGFLFLLASLLARKTNAAAM
jgi:hypothetical protein